MARPDLVPIKVKILRGPDGAHAYPPFNQLPAATRGHMDWSKFFDAHGLGWHYDGCGFGELDQGDDAAHEHANTDPDCWFGCTLVPEDFAAAAAARWPELVSELTEESWEAFHDDRAHATEEVEHLDTEALQGLLARIQLERDPDAPTVEPSAEVLALRAQMLDPEDQKRGIRKNRRRRWADVKADRGVTVHPRHRKERPGGPSA